jgi:hypothetical protein
MFLALRDEVESRLLLIQQSLAALARIEGDATFPPEVSKSLKGLTFVQLYAVYEHCVSSAVQVALRGLNSTGLALRELRHELLSLALDDHCKSLAACGPDRTWEVRMALMSRTRSVERVQAPETLFPADGSHYRIGQLRTIWALFGIGTPHVPDGRLIGRIDELVELRNGIAHGRMRAEEVGGRFSLQDLESRHSDTAQICRHVIGALEAHLADPGQLRA